ncbi:MAG: LysE family transporter [Pseudomonadota bacterium]
MGWEHLLAFNLALIAAILSPGPAFLVAVRTTLVSGRRAGVALGAGLGVMAAGWTLAALLGLELIFTLFPWAYLAVKIAGGLYLAWIAWRLWRDARKPLSAAAQPARRAFWDGLMINLLNPKSVLFAAAVLVVALPPDLSPAEKALITANHLAVELIFYTGLAFALSRPGVSAAYLRAKAVIDRVAGAVLGLFAARLLTDR